MKIKMTIFNGGQEHYEFDTDTLKEGESFDKFLVSKDQNERIYVVPMIKYGENCYYPGPVLEPL
jgi:hypothetical protein